MPLRLTPKQFEVLHTLKTNPGSKIPVSWWKSVPIWDKDGIPSLRWGWVQNRTLEHMTRSGLLVKGSQWYTISPTVTTLNKARLWVTLSHEG